MESCSCEWNGRGGTDLRGDWLIVLLFPLSASGEGLGGEVCGELTPPLTPPRLRGGEEVKRLGLALFLLEFS